MAKSVKEIIELIRENNIQMVDFKNFLFTEMKHFASKYNGIKIVMYIIMRKRQVKKGGNTQYV